MISPEEAQGRASFLLDRLLPNMDRSRPIPVEELRRALERLRREREAQFGRGPSGSQSDRDRDSSRDRGSSASSSQPPGVPGFGVELQLPPVPGFGANAEQFAINITDSDRSEAQRALSRYDENRDGVIDREEARRGRWSNDPFQFDRDGDGRLTLTELALRYANRRMERERERSSSGGDFNRGGGPPQFARSGESSRFEGFSRFGGSGGPGGPPFRSGDGFSRFGGSFRGDDQQRSRDRGEDGRSSSDATSSSALPKIPVYRARSAYERLPSGLPSWFRDKDQNLDGQVMMHEFASEWSEQQVAEFSRYDLNGDGVITAEECLKAAEGARPVRSILAAATSTGSTANGASYSNSNGSNSNSAASSSAPSTTASSTTTTGSASVPQMYMRYAEGLLKRYDKNADGVLTEDEWKEMSRPPEGADTDGDGKITAQEYALWLMKRPR